MNKRITQATQNDKQISKSIKRFFTRFHIFSNRSMYMSTVPGKNTPDFAKSLNVTVQYHAMLTLLETA